MKKIFLKGCIFLLMIIVPFGYLNYRYKNTNYYKEMNDLGKFREIPYDIQIVNLGNSHANIGIVYPDNTNMKGYNLALDSQPFEYDYYILDYYADHLSDGATVIIPISYFDWYYRYEEIFMGEISTYNERYYSILDKEHIMNYDLSKDILYNHFALLTAGKNIGYIFEDIPKMAKGVNNQIVADIDQVADRKYESWTKEVMARDSQERETYEQKNTYYLKKMLDYCYEQGFQPVLVTLPVTDQLDSRFSEEFKNDFYQNCTEILEEYEGLRYFNYIRREEFSGNLNYFLNADHLNAVGANAFSERLFLDLKEAGLLPNDR